MAKRQQYRTLRGKLVDMDLLQKKNELTPAVGNARVNARGDELGAGGQIIKKREDRVKEYYNVNVAKESSGRARKAGADSPAPATTPEPTKKVQEQIEEPTQQEQVMLEEFDEEPEWLEDENGNFYRKGDR